ncbi:hypothetical protein BOTBODRAFT_30851 [Botryobasidium botryosum FD-172 SS1]|uniref:Uncharacterized protein n=1 Tax=Botryobasidium botryosum (strain FD-172 SS1) TaxID=930990 RepID=A0A067MP72_BOTB1|nr:hypothetical protein BOTBODRAFT_30851 [Botryobasidium botryosum FD-172 SS1]
MYDRVRTECWCVLFAAWQAPVFIASRARVISSVLPQTCACAANVSGTKAGHITTIGAWHPEVDEMQTTQGNGIPSSPAIKPAVSRCHGVSDWVTIQSIQLI